MHLVKSGTPDLALLSEAWAKIYAEYIELMDDADARYAALLMYNAYKLQNLITLLESCILALRVKYDQNWHQVLIDEGFAVNLNPDDPKTYQSILTGADQRLGGKRIHLKLKFAELDALNEDRDPVTEEVKPMHFTKILLAIAKYRQVSILRPEKLYTDEYVLMFKDYIDYCTQVRQQNKK